MLTVNALPMMADPVAVTVTGIVAATGLATLPAANVTDSRLLLIDRFHPDGKLLIRVK